MERRIEPYMIGKSLRRTFSHIHLFIGVIESLTHEGRGRFAVPRQICSEQPVAAIDNLTIDQARFSHKLMRFDRTSSVDVENFVPVSHEPV